MTSWILAFAAMFALDYCWGRWSYYVTHKRPHRAAAWATVLYALTAYLYVTIVGNPWLLAPACAGAYLGTWASVRISS